MVCPKRTSRAKYDWQSRPYAVAPQERSDWQGASRIMVCPKRTSRAKYDWQGRPYALFLQENERNEVRLERNSRIMVLLQICDLAKQTLCCCTPRTE